MSTTAADPKDMLRSGLKFERLAFASELHTPRIGRVTLQRTGINSTKSPNEIVIDTPGAMTWTSRGVIPHLTRDHIGQSNTAGWIHVPFESFLERNPPVPAFQSQTNPQDNTPLHSFLGYPPSRHIVSVSLRDPNDVRELPPNGDNSISAWCVRGVRKVPPATFNTHALSCRPDVIFSPSDTPYTPSPFSQRRVTKNVERTASWLVEVLKSISSSYSDDHPRPPIVLTLAGLNATRARAAFSTYLLEALTGREAVELGPMGYQCLDEGVWGYAFELNPLRITFLNPSEATNHDLTKDHFTDAVDAIRTSLNPLSQSKPRIAFSTNSPHEILRLVDEVGIDLFDVSAWASNCARLGIGLDFIFPAPVTSSHSHTLEHSDGKRDLGHNFFSEAFEHDFQRIGDNFIDSSSANANTERICKCIACSPAVSPETQDQVVYDPPHTRAYIHHLLHTHEMSAYAFLEAHNAFVVGEFFSGIRKTLSSTSSSTGLALEHFHDEVVRFHACYATTETIISEATARWAAVEHSRGKGSLKRVRDAEAAEKGAEEIEAAVALGGDNKLADLMERAKLDAPTVLVLDPAPNCDIDVEVLSNT